MKYHSSEEDFIDAHYNDTWLTVEQVAQQLSCSQRKVYHMIENKDILSKNTIDRTFSEDEMKAIKLKSFGEYSIVGQSKLPFDLPGKIDGSAKYGSDVFVPNMVYGIPVPNPVRWGAIPQSVDESDAKKIDGYVGAYVEKEGFARINTGYVVAFVQYF